MKRKGATAVLALASVSLALYALLLGIIPDLSESEPSFAHQIFPWVAEHPKESLGQAHSSGAVLFTVAVLALFVCYVLALRAVKCTASARLERFVFVAGAAFLVLQLLGPALLATDLYGYVVYGRIAGMYHGDPYGPAPPAFGPNDWYPQLWGREYLPSWYGPVWTALSVALTQLAGNHVGFAVLLFRCVAVAAALVIAAFIWGCLRRTAPEQAARGIVLFLWNPLVVLEVGLSGHNDALMAAGLVGAVWLLTQERRTLAAVALTLSAWVKLTTALLLPILLIVVLRGIPSWRGRLRYLAAAVLFGGIATAIVFLGRPLESIAPVFGAGTDAGSYTNSLHELAFRGLRVWFGESPESANVSPDFEGWWIISTTGTQLRARGEPDAPVMGPVAPGTLMLVLAPQKTEWLWVYDAAGKLWGYVHESVIAETLRPAAADTDQVIMRLEAGPKGSDSVIRANGLIRLLTWSVFGSIWLFAAWRASSVREFAVYSVSVLLAADWLLAGWFWPWYVIWPLALAALVPTTRPPGLAVLLSATVLMLYPLYGADEWLNRYRALPALALPLLLFGSYQLLLPRLRRARHPTASHHTLTERA